MSRQLLEQITASHWDSGKPEAGSGFARVRWLQGLNDLVNRPVINRVTATTSATAIAANGAVQSTGIGTGAIQPKRYGEVTIKARVSFNLNSVGPGYHYIYRTLGAIPANGAAPNAGDVIVGGDAFLGGPTGNGVNQSGAFSFLDTGLDVSKQYRYYLAVKAPNGNTLNLVNNSQLLAMERS
jgi:hypothetical protein